MRIGPWEIALIAMVVIVLFGAKKIPEIMRGLGLGVKEFKSGLRDQDDEKKSSSDENKTDEKEESSKSEK
ncbi:twin-arginine translocase TatA/TatE family subunit [bacterium]|nr:twin-arginine translocase TatA/TatE family subunit [bacterium]